LTNTIVIADSSELILNGLKVVLQPEFDNEIILVKNYDSLLENLYDLENPILIIDYTSDGFSLDKIVDIKHMYPSVNIMAITPFTNAQTIVEAVKAGVSSHVKKECSAKEIKSALNSTLSGEKFFCSDIANQLKSESINIDKISFKSLAPSSLQISERELQIIQFIAEGYTNSQIAAIIYLSNHTVNTHRKNIMKKLGVNNTAGIVMYAVKTEMVSPNQFSFKKSTKV